MKKENEEICRLAQEICALVQGRTARLSPGASGDARAAIMSAMTMAIVALVEAITASDPEPQQARILESLPEIAAEAIRACITGSEPLRAPNASRYAS